MRSRPVSISISVPSGIQFLSFWSQVADLADGSNAFLGASAPTSSLFGRNSGGPSAASVARTVSHIALRPVRRFKGYPNGLLAPAPREP